MVSHPISSLELLHTSPGLSTFPPADITCMVFVSSFLIPPLQIPDQDLCLPFLPARIRLLVVALHPFRPPPFLSTYFSLNLSPAPFQPRANNVSFLHLPLFFPFIAKLGETFPPLSWFLLFYVLLFCFFFAAPSRSAVVSPTYPFLSRLCG